MNQVTQLQGNNIAETNKPKPLDIFKDQLSKQKDEFSKVLPSHITFEKFQRTVMTAIITNPSLLTADRQSLLVSCIKAATDGLLPDQREAAFVVYKTKEGNNWIDKVQYMPMYLGILKKVRNSGEIVSIVTHAVYEKDKFDYILGDEESIKHEPYMGDEDQGKIIAAYCIVKLKDGSIVREVMLRRDLEKVRKASKSGSVSENDVKYNKDLKLSDPKGIWKEWYEEMARKSVFRRCAKWLPQNIEIIDRLFDNDDSMEGFSEIEANDPIMIENHVGENELPAQPDLVQIVNDKKDEEKVAVSTTTDQQQSLV